MKISSEIVQYKKIGFHGVLNSSKSLIPTTVSLMSLSASTNNVVAQTQPRQCAYCTVYTDCQKPMLCDTCKCSRVCCYGANCDVETVDLYYRNSGRREVKTIMPVCLWCKTAASVLSPIRQ